MRPAAVKFLPEPANATVETNQDVRRRQVVVQLMRLGSGPIRGPILFASREKTIPSGHMPREDAFGERCLPGVRMRLPCRRRKRDGSLRRSECARWGGVEG